jgi:tRNA pseudouridine55 synthase
MSEARVREALVGFLGTRLQRPPQYSAKHVGGERSHHKARRGEIVELADVRVTVDQIDLVEYRPPDATFRVVVSAGTYVRAIGRDLGDVLGVGAHLTSLRREAIGALRVEDSLALHQLSPAGILPVQTVLGNLPMVNLDEDARQAVVHGRAVADGRAAGRQGSGAVALMAGGELVAVARTEDGWLHPTVVLGTG